MIEEKDRNPDGFDKKHYDQKQQRKNRRQKTRTHDGGKRIHRVGSKERWQWNGKVDYQAEADEDFADSIDD